MDLDDSDTDFLWQCKNGDLKEPCDHPKPEPPNCSASTESWTVGALTCGGSLSETWHGTSLTVDADSPYVGSATFACSASEWGPATDASCECEDGYHEHNGQCVENPVCGENAVCADGDCDDWSDDNDVASYGSGSGMRKACSVGMFADVGDTDARFRWRCTNGGMTENCHDDRPDPSDCPPMVTWTAGSRTCEASVTQIGHGTDDLVVDAESPYNGSATLACSDGVWSSTNATCECGGECLCVVAGNEWMEARPERERTCVGNDACLPDSHRHSCTTPADPNGGYSSCRYDRHRGGIYCASHRTETCEPYPAVPAHCHVEPPPCEICCEFGEQEYCP